MRIVIFGNNYNLNFSAQIQLLLDVLMKHNTELLIEEQFFHFITETLNLHYPNCELLQATNSFHADMAISVGGDGTFLTTAARIGSQKIPILGINTGHLGFLAEVSDHEIEQALEDILHGKYKIEERTVLQAHVSEDSSLGTLYALNEVAVMKQDLSAMILVTATVDGEELNTYRSDGLIVSTPTGSTAYSLSVGGPILAPSTHNFVVMPIASHSLTVRPLILPDNCQIELRVSSRSQSYMLALDGRSFLMSEQSVITIRRADYTIKSVKPLHHTFFKTLKNKLMWGADVRQ